MAQAAQNDAAQNDDAPLPDWFLLLAGDWKHCRYKWFRDTNRHEMIIIISGMVYCWFLFATFLDMMWAASATFAMLGLFYQCLPYDLVDDESEWEICGKRIPIGKMDDLLILLGGSVISASCGYKAYDKTPLNLTIWKGAFLVVLIWVCYVAYNNKDFSTLLVGIFTCVGQAPFILHVIPNNSVGFGVSLWLFGFYYNLIPRAIIPSPTIVFGWDIGKLDNIFLGYTPVLTGIVIAVASTWQESID